VATPTSGLVARGRRNLFFNAIFSVTALRITTILSAFGGGRSPLQIWHDNWVRTHNVWGQSPQSENNSFWHPEIFCILLFSFNFAGPQGPRGSRSTKHLEKIAKSNFEEMGQTHFAGVALFPDTLLPELGYRALGTPRSCKKRRWNWVDIYFRSGVIKVRILGFGYLYFRGSWDL